LKIADAQRWNKKTYNNAISALRRAFAFGYRDHSQQRDPAASLQSARIGKKHRPAIDPFSIQEAELLIAALHHDWGEAQGNYDEFRFFTGLRPSEQIALVVSDYDPVHRILSVTKARMMGLDKGMRRSRNLHVADVRRPVWRSTQRHLMPLQSTIPKPRLHGSIWCNAGLYRPSTTGG
jgi:integrase